MENARIFGVLVGLLTLIACGPNSPPLHLAARGGNETEVRRLLDSGAPVDETDRGGTTALAWALSEHRFRVADLLVRRGIDLDHVDGRGESLMWTFRNDAPVKRWLAGHGRPVVSADGLYVSDVPGRLRLVDGEYDSDALSFGNWYLANGELVLLPQTDLPALRGLEDAHRADAPSRLRFVRKGDLWISCSDRSIAFRMISDPGGNALASSLKSRPLETSRVSNAH